MTPPAEISDRARRHGALSDPIRLAIVDELFMSNRAPMELGERLDLPSNLLAHHLIVLEESGLISRSRSSGDGRRRYVHLHSDAFDGLLPAKTIAAQPAMFVCSANSARSQLAAALWEAMTDKPAISAGTHPAESVHAGAVAAAKRAGLNLADAIPSGLDEIARRPGLVITVCDQAYEEIDVPSSWLHWSIPDPVPAGTAAAFDEVVASLRDRIATVFGVNR